MNDDTQQLIAEENVKDNGEHANHSYINIGEHSTENNENHQENATEDISDNAKTLPQYIATITATLAAFAAGTVLAWTSPITSDLIDGKFNNISINVDEMGWIGSFVTLGAMSMCFPYGYICDQIGRRSALLLLIIPFTIGWSLIIWSKNILMIYIGRFITGTAAGACCVAAPLYTSEIAQKEIRGTLGGYFQLMITAGIFFAYTVGKYTNPFDFTVICASTPFVFFILFVFQPESPIYCMKKGNAENARNSLICLRGSTYNLETEIDYIKTVLDINSQNDIFTTILLKKRIIIKGLIIALALMFFQQLSGINAIIFYTSNIFEDSGVKLDPKISSMFVGGFQVLATFISSLAVDRLGRRILLISSNFIMSLSIVLLGIFFTLKDRHLISSDAINMLNFLPVLSICIYIVVFSMGLGPIPWTITNELFTPEFKSYAASSAAMLNWFLAFIITKFYFKLKVQIGSDIMFYTFGAICFCGALFCYFIVPETKGKTISQVEEELKG